MSAEEVQEVQHVKLPLLDVRTVPLSSIHPNPWNPNVQDERTYEAERESIRTYGFLDPITVRPHPTLAGELVATGGDGFSETEWQTIDGEHRGKAAGDEGYIDVSINSIGPVDDATAQKLTIILNETRGDADVSLLGSLLSGLATQFDTIEELANALPYTGAELDHLLAIGAHDWDSFRVEQENENTRRAAEQPPSGKFTVFLAFDEAQRGRWDELASSLGKEHEGKTLEECILLGLTSACALL